MSFDSLKKNRTKAFENLNAQLQKMNTKTKTSYADPLEETYWKPTRDAAGNAFAIIRFLPGKDEEVPFKIIYSHSFTGPTGLWYIENNRTTLGSQEADPANEYYWKLYNASKDENSPERKQASAMRRRVNYVSNILVIKDSGNPENNNRVFRYKYGPKIWGKLDGLMNPQFEDEKGVNPFDLWSGANFRLKVTGQGRDTSYEKSSFDNPSELFDGDEDKLKAVYDKLYSLDELVTPDKFKSYDVLKAKLYRVLGISDTESRGNASAMDDEPDEEMNIGKMLGKETNSKSMPTKLSSFVEGDEEEDDDLAEFARLAKMS